MTKYTTNQEFRELSAFLGLFFDRYMAGDKPIPPEIHPVMVVQGMAERAPKRALLGLRMAIADCIEAAAPWSYQKVQEADEALKAKGVVTLSELRRRYWRRFAAIVDRGRIVSEADYYLVKGIAADASTPSDQVSSLDRMLADYEARQVP